MIRSAKRRDAVIDVVTVLVVVFGLNLLIWGDLAARGVVAVWVVILLMFIRVLWGLIYRRYVTRRNAR